MSHHHFNSGSVPPWARGLGGGGFGMADDFYGYSEERQLRMTRLDQIMPALTDGFVPSDLKKEQLKLLMKDLKEEGNSLFSEKSYRNAAEYYTHGLLVARHLQDGLLEDLDKQMVSVLFSNRAACCIKMDMYKQAAEDCDFAIDLRKDNVKAYYRKADALKSARQYEQALKVAIEGQRKAEEAEKSNEDYIKNFKVLIRELRSHVEEDSSFSQQDIRNNNNNKPPNKPAPLVPRPLPAAVPKANPPKVNKTSTQNINPPSETNGAATGNQKATATVSAKNKIKTKNDNVDESWLQGTNAIGGSPSRNSHKPDKHKASKLTGNKSKSVQSSGNKSPRSAYQGRFAGLQQDALPSDMEDTEDSDSQYSSTDESVANGTASPPPGGAVGPEFMKVSRKQLSKQDESSKLDGLDDFGVNQSNNIDLMADFSPVFSRAEPAPPPFDTEYDYTLVCSSCYSYKGTGGLKGYTVKPKLSHRCASDVLLIRNQSGDEDWVKIRPRPIVKSAEFSGRFRLCTQYSHGLSCRVSEDYCSFAHSDKEIELWEMDRREELSIKDFINDQKTKLASGKSIRLYRQVEAAVEAPVRQKSLKAEPLPIKPAAPIVNVPPTSAPLTKPAPIGSNRPSRLQASNGSLAPARPPPVPVPSWADTMEESHLPVGPVLTQYPIQQVAPPVVRPDPVNAVAYDRGRGIPFPLENSHYYRLACNVCMKPRSNNPSNYVGQYELLRALHTCSENILAVQTKGDTYWKIVRERRNHRPFKGSYIPCKYQCGVSPQKCPIPDEACMYAHNDVECILWTLEKDGIFSIPEFKLQCRKGVDKQDVTVDDILKKHPGRFVFLCRDCFYNDSMISCYSDRQRGLCSAEMHCWEDTKQLMHYSERGILTPIAIRPFQHKDAFFLMCNKMQYCLRQHASMTSKRPAARCHFSHSAVERDVWLLERDTGMTRNEMVDQCNSMGRLVAAAAQTQAIAQASLSNTSNRSTPSSSGTSLGSSGYASANQSTPVSISPPPRPQCPQKINVVCSLCWKNGKLSVKDGKHNRCNNKNSHSNWESNKIHVIVANRQPLKPLPRKIPKGNRFLMCHHITTKKKCENATGGPCQFAHSEEEMEIWTYMAEQRLMTFEALMETFEKPAEPKVTKPIAKGESLVVAHSVNPAPRYNSKSAYMDLSMNVHYCHYCSVQCNSNKQWTEHCASDKHMFNVNTDREHQWNYRQPRWNVSNVKYQLCKEHERGTCRYSELPDMYNACPFAHSQQELDEWKERYEFRQMKRAIARKDHVFSYMDTLQEEFEGTKDGVNVICDNVPDVNITCDNSLSVYKQEKAASMTWTFIITSLGARGLEKVALLYDKDRLHFHLTDNEFQPCQIADGDIYQSFDQKGRPVYKIVVSFTGGIFGSFAQWVVFDFGSRPVICRKLNVELGTQFVQEKVQKLRENLKFDRWTGDNRVIEYFQHLTGEIDDNVELLKEYRPPSSADTVITQESVGVELNRHNYVHKMHKLLNLEELTQARIISSFNLETEMEIVKSIQEKTYIFARKGELFAKLMLNDELCEDTDAGKLVLSSVTKVFLAPKGTGSRQVYEAIIVNKEHFDYDGRGRDYIYLCLSSRCCHDLELIDGSVMAVEVQFQMDRLPFGYMHFALDLMKDNPHMLAFVFPDVRKAIPAWHNQQTVKITSQILNPDQVKIVQHVVSERPADALPLIVYGPFGTGKTETLAQCAMALLKSGSNARILICTHSNSAADLYITKHMDAFITQHAPHLRLLRLYFSKRRINTVNQTVQKYCYFTPDNRSFAIPTKEYIAAHNIVITTLSTSLCMARQPELRGSFTHIFLDEAAQALECETIIPLCLATERTCVVLAGDHLQMTKKVYSKEAGMQKFNRSLLERLYRHYDQYSQHAENGATPSILLRNNYRTKMEILRFISAIFYGGPKSLAANSHQPEVEGLVPLTFHVASGREIQDSDSTSYYNVAEIEEITARVEELYLNWPPTWGAFSAELIGVVTPYTDQVNKIRTSLRRKRRELKGVVVERMMNMQGKEFRAVFISTVRTRHILDAPPRVPRDTSECDGDYGDLGFLSDQKLLNTAFTRAQSMVAVIGDPVALCAIGDCINIWRSYLKHCTQLKSITPQSVSLETVRMQVVSLMNSPLGQNLISITSAQREGSVNGASRGDSPEFPTVTGYKGPLFNGKGEASPLRPGAADEETARAIIEDWNLDFQVEADDIIKQLAKDEIKNQPAAGQKTIKPALDEPLKLECIYVHPEEGHAVMHYSTSRARKKTRRLLTDHDSARPFDSDSDLSDDETTAGGKPVYCDYTPQILMDFVRSEPAKYKHCILHIENSRRMIAKPIDPNDPINEIKLSSRLRCGRGFNNDEVVVELLRLDDEDNRALPDEEKAVVHGEVKGVVHRAINPKYRMFVCMVEQGNTGLMVPLNRGIPKIYNVENTHRFHKTRKGHVCVYTFTKDREIVFDRYEPIDPGDTTKLFIVRYLKWDAKFYSPLGVVVGVVPAGNTVERGMKILDIEHSIPKRFRPDTLAEVERNFSANYIFPQASLRGRLDFRDKLVFTIDPSESRDLDDALSMEQLGDTLVVGIHIADVAHFVKPGSALDREAESRGSSFYRLSQDPVPMLPDRLSSELCSLLPEQDRLAMSLFIKMNMRAEVVDMEIRKTIIRSKYKLDYEDAETILNEQGGDYNQILTVQVMFLYRIAKMWREKRLGHFPSHYHPFDPESTHTPKSHTLVEEMMIMANHQVANFLLRHFPTTTPLRVQGDPSESELKEWRTRFAKIAHNSVGLTAPFKPKDLNCICAGECTCVNFADLNNAPPLDFITVHKDKWEQIIQWVLPEEGRAPDFTRAKSALLMLENHPQMAVALMALRALQCRSSYISSGDVKEANQSHHSINLMSYTHFTSPIRRYMDLVIHRMIESAVFKQPLPFSSAQDVTAICRRATDVSVKVSKYDLATRALHLSSFMHQLPLVLNPVVQDFDDSGMSLRFPTLPLLPPSCGRVTFNSLGPSQVPVTDQEKQSLYIHWQQRIYNVARPALAPGEVLKYSSGQPILLDPYRFVHHIPVQVWRELLQALIHDISINIMKATGTAIEQICRFPSSVNFSADATSEAKNLRNDDHHVNFAVNLPTSSVVEVQIVAELHKGLLSPTLQLLSVTPSLDICLEHRKNPTRCFAGQVNTIAAKPYYKDVASYQKSWLPLVALEAAKGGITGDNSAIIHNVNIKWFEEKQITGEVYTGALYLPIDFCRERHIKFSCERVVDDSVPDELKDNDNYASASDLTFDFICVRYKNINPVPPANILIMGKFDLQVKPVNWVGHCITTGVKMNKQTGMLIIELKLHQNSVQFPRELLMNDKVATIEWIPKGLPDRRVENALKALKNSSPLSKAIATGKQSPPLDPSYVRLALAIGNQDYPFLSSPNQGQAAAIQASLSNSFTLIQGPPGTGKTITGVRLAYLFARINEMTLNHCGDSSMSQVLYCGPSNKSVDVVANYLMKLGTNCPIIIRVYSEMLEHKEFPLPLDVSSPRQRASLSESGPDPVLKCVALHHVIRLPGNLYSREITEMDHRIKHNPNDISEEELQEYLGMIDRAQADALRRAAVILCTCSASAAKRITRCNYRQVIIDEAGMCTEPETMVPIISSKALQAVLIGDHRQLRPIVLDDTSRTLGLERSLFERYSDNAVMLQEQYRMHHAICAFPSQMFYDNKLQPAVLEQKSVNALKFWPNGKEKPISFVHVVGREVNQTVATADGSLMSKSNVEEANHAVRFATQLVRRFHIPARDVVVLSQYRSQCTEIERQLELRSEKDINVSTVVASQGSEWEYVILSTVRSLPKLEIEKNPTNGWKRRHLGFIMDEHQINVAITRAKKGLIILGNKYLLRCDPMWQKLLRHYEALKKIVNAEDFMTTKSK